MVINNVSKVEKDPIREQRARHVQRDGPVGWAILPAAALSGGYF